MKIINSKYLANFNERYVLLKFNSIFLKHVHSSLDALNIFQEHDIVK